MAELEAGAEPAGRVRRPGGGRKRAADTDPGLVPALLALVEPDERGDPQSPLRWTVKSTRTLAAELTRQGHKVSADTVGDLLRGQGFSLQASTIRAASDRAWPHLVHAAATTQISVLITRKHLGPMRDAQTAQIGRRMVPLWP